MMILWLFQVKIGDKVEKQEKTLKTIVMTLWWRHQQLVAN